MKIISCHCWLTTVLCLLLLNTAHAQNRTNPPPRTSNASPIRRIDFRNFTYPLSQSSSELYGVRSLRVRNGKWSNGLPETDTNWQAFTVRKVLYGDLTGDGQEEAVVLTQWDQVGANPENSTGQEVYVYALRGRESTLIVGPDGLDYWHDYDRYQKSDDMCNNWIFGMAPAAVQNGLLVIHLVAGGRFCKRPGAYAVTMKYRVQGNRLVLTSPPLKVWRRQPWRA